MSSSAAIESDSIELPGVCKGPWKEPWSVCRSKTELASQLAGDPKELGQPACCFRGPKTEGCPIHLAVGSWSRYLAWLYGGNVHREDICVLPWQMRPCGGWKNKRKANQNKKIKLPSPPSVKSAGVTVEAKKPGISPSKTIKLWMDIQTYWLSLRCFYHGNYSDSKSSEHRPGKSCQVLKIELH